MLSYEYLNPPLYLQTFRKEWEILISISLLSQSYKEFRWLKMTFSIKADLFFYSIIKLNWKLLYSLKSKSILSVLQWCSIFAVLEGYTWILILLHIKYMILIKISLRCAIFAIVYIYIYIYIYMINLDRRFMSAYYIFDSFKFHMNFLTLGWNKIRNVPYIVLALLAPIWTIFGEAKMKWPIQWQVIYICIKNWRKNKWIGIYRRKVFY